MCPYNTNTPTFPPLSQNYKLSDGWTDRLTRTNLKPPLRVGALELIEITDEYIYFQYISHKTINNSVKVTKGITIRM